MSPHGAPTRDPRSIITPDAFEVAPRLLGMPLAAPMKRFWAILIDLAVIGLITLLTKSFALVLGVVAAILFIRGSMKRTKVRGSVFGRAMRLSQGCLGVVIGVVTAVVWVAVGSRGFGGSSSGDGESAVQATLQEAGVRAGGRGALSAVIGGLGHVREYRGADDYDEAVSAATALARQLHAAGWPSTDIRDLLTDGAPEDRPWFGRIDEVVEQAMAAADAAVMDTAAAGEASPDRRLALLDSVAADTLRALNERIAEMEDDAIQSEQETRALSAAVRQKEEGSGFFAWISGFVNQLGFGFGWASLYMTVMLSWWKGQTIGKRAMGIRVLRLDGEPITWWGAFERAGGYAAGFATGLLGFAQVFWDANRQAIHDRIVGTVVVIDGAEKDLDWENAL